MMALPLARASIPNSPGEAPAFRPGFCSSCSHTPGMGSGKETRFLPRGPPPDPWSPVSTSGGLPEEVDEAHGETNVQVVGGTNPCNYLYCS